MTSKSTNNKSTTPKSASTSSSTTKVTTSDPKTSSSPTVVVASSRTKFKRPGVLLFALMLVTFVIFFTILMLRRNSTSAEICRTEACVEAGKMLFESINFTVSPCDDFYEYACGNWVALNPIPDDKSFIGTFERLEENLVEEIRQLLEEKPKESDAKSVQFALDLYRECMDQKTRDIRGLKPLQHLLSQSLGTSWPILDVDRVRGQGNFMETYTKVKNAGASPIVSFAIVFDAKQADLKVISFNAPLFGLERHEFANQTEHNGSITAYRKLMLDYGKLFAGPDVDEKMLATRLDEIFEFESQLALFSRRKEESRDANVLNNKMSLGQFTANTSSSSSSFNWTAYLNLYIAPLNLSYRFNETDLVIVEDVAYYQKMVKLVQETPTYVLHNYMGWLLAVAWSSAMDSQLRALAFAHSTATTGIKKMLPDWKRCVAQVNGLMDWAVSQLYVDQLVVAGTKARAEEMITDLRAAFRELVQTEIWWLDEDTKRLTLQKADATQYYVAYPDWIADNAEVDGLYGFSEVEGFAKVVEGRYFEAFLEMMKFTKGKAFQEFHKKRNDTLFWLMTPATVNAAAGPSSNTVTILRPPFFDPGRPAYLNYGAIGAVIGHEITHHFDDEGSQYDKAGNLVNWWSEETKVRFQNGSHCFIQQYSAIVDKATGKKLNGINTQGENIADNGGIREAFLAFKSLAAKGLLPLVPQMESFTPPQLFFLSWAKVWCNNERLLSQVKNIASDVHAPGKYRVNVPLGNFNQFAKAFSCPAGSKMNPVKKCQLW